jgi:16S rRNA (adenine1518-N6/adenine1519-N6)-dimethyltransferase
MHHGGAMSDTGKRRRLASPAPKKSLGQRFLVEDDVARRIVAALEIRQGDLVVEIGPGRGILTRYLAASPAKVVAVEIDQRLVPKLQKSLSKFDNVEIRHADFLETNLSQLISRGPAKLVGNLPYHLVSEIVFKLFDHARQARSDKEMPWIECAVLMMQREVAERIVADEGSKTYGIVSIFCQLEGQVDSLLVVPASCFSPRPKVDGEVLRLSPYRRPPVYPENWQVLERIVRWCFHRRRKMLRSTLASLAGVHPFWQELPLDFRRRPEELSPAEWVALADGIWQRQQGKSGTPSSGTR